MIRRLHIAGLACGFLAAVPATAETGDIPLYRATYEVEYKGRHLADAEFSVTSQGDDRFTFESSTKARLLLRMAAPNAAIEHSEFRLDGGEIRPIAFRYEDASRDREDSYSIEFDTAAGEAQVTSGRGARAETLEDGALDRGSLQVVMMQDLARCRNLGPYKLIDDEGIDMYEFERLDDETAETGLGDIATRRYRQHREGSSRETVIWAAPEYAFLPVRIEQFRNGELQTALILDKLDGIERRPGDC